MPFKLAVVAQTLEIKLLYYEKYFEIISGAVDDASIDSKCPEEG